MSDQNLVVRWVTIAVAFAAIGGGAFSIVQIHKDLTDITTMLRDIQDDQADGTAASDTRFQTRADEHRDIAEGVHWIRGAMAMNACVGRPNEHQ